VNPFRANVLGNPAQHLTLQANLGRVGFALELTLR
jgi:hypothetical protein